MKILIIDDHPLFMDGVSQVLMQLADDVTISKVMSISDAIRLLESQPDFDLILLDLTLPGVDGFSFLHRFSAEEYCIPVIVVSAEEQLGLIRRALDANVMGFVPKSFNACQMLAAFKDVLEGNHFIPESIKDSLHRIAAPNKLNKLPIHIQKSGISSKQYEVLQLIAKGYSNLTIAELLNRTEHTVKSHVAALFQIMGVKNRTECVEMARKYGLVE